MAAQLEETTKAGQPADPQLLLLMQATFEISQRELNGRFGLAPLAIAG